MRSESQAGGSPSTSTLVDTSQASPYIPVLIQVALIFLVPTAIILLQKVLASAQVDNTITPNSNATVNTNERSSAHHHRRRIQHALTGLSFYLLSYALPRSLSTTLLSLSTILLYILNLTRSLSPPLQSHYLTHFGPLLRTHELSPGVLPGAFWYLAGITVTSLLIPDLDVARVGVLCLALADPTAAGVGLYFPRSALAFEVSRFGRIRLAAVGHDDGGKKDGTAGVGNGGGGSCGRTIDRKSLAGCGACFLVSFLVAQASGGEERGGWGWDASLVAAFATMVLEGVVSSFIGVDDNFLIPIGTSLALLLYNDR